MKVKRVKLFSVTLNRHAIRQLFNIIQQLLEILKNPYMVRRNMSKGMIEDLRMFNILLRISFKIFNDLCFQ